jgi:competence protein ComEC
MSIQRPGTPSEHDGAGGPAARRRIEPAWLLALLLTAALVAAPGCRRPKPPGPASGPVPGRLEVWFLDVGQGDSTLVRTPGGITLLIDGGRGSAGETVLAALQSRGIRSLDYVIASHPHEDHIGGLIDVLSAVPARQVLDSGYPYPSPVVARYLRLIKQRAYPFRRIVPGTTLGVAPDVALEFVAPPSPFLSGTGDDVNNNSVVFRLSYGRVRFLFTGDMEEAERAWIAQSPHAGWLPADVLKVAHHGSYNGTNAAFLRRVRPSAAVISSGGEYGHPHLAAITALEQARVRVFRTDRQGTIAASTDGRDLRIGPERPGARGANDTAAVDRPPAAAGPFIGNPRTRVYHRPDCPDLPGRGNRVSFADSQDAIRQGYRPHARCVGGTGRAK